VSREAGEPPRSRAPVAIIRGVAVPDLDRWLADPSVRTRHGRGAPVDEDRLWAAARTVNLRDCRILGRLIPARIAGVRADATFDELFAAAPFTVLEEGPTHRLSGLCGRIWTVRGQFAPLADPGQFLTWDQPGTVRVLFASWAQPASPGATLVSEVRVAPVDARASLYLRALGPFIAAFQGLVGTEPLDVAVRRAVRAG
jgi:hypothetical protein